MNVNSMPNLSPILDVGSPPLQRIKWSQEMDKVLLEKIKMRPAKGLFYGKLTKDLKVNYSETFPSFLTSKQVQERYRERICPDIITNVAAKIDSVTKEKIFTLLKQYPNQWSFISKKLCEEGDGKRYYPPNTIKNLAFKSISKNKLKNAFIPIEEEISQGSPISRDLSTPIKKAVSSFGYPIVSPALDEELDLIPIINEVIYALEDQEEAPHKKPCSDSFSSIN